MTPQEISKQLQEPMAYQWKIQTGKANGNAQCVAYIDARDVMDRLDKVVGVENWQDKYRRDEKGLVICSIGIKFGGEWVWKEDTGTSGDIEVEKSEISDAFKRTAVKWGIGRFLYNLDFRWVKLDADKKPIDDKGQRIYDLTKYFNQVGNSKPIDPKPAHPTTAPVSPAVDGDDGFRCATCRAKMVHKEGVAKSTGKPYRGWFCPNARQGEAGHKPFFDELPVKT